ncbi:hypothetical protein [Sorlinia euscelidii]
MASCAINAHATTPSGGWTLKETNITAKDYSLRIDVDPGEKYNLPGMAPSSVYWAQMVRFNEPEEWYKSRTGYLGLMRGDGVKRAIASIWGGLDAKAGAIPVVKCNEFGACVSINGPYDWKVGHNYRLRMEKSARTPSDAQGVWWEYTLADLTTGTVDILGELKTPLWGGLRNNNGVFLEYFQGPFDCATLRHARVTMGQIRGNYGEASALASSNGNAYGETDNCAKANILPGMTSADYGSASWDTQGTLTLLGDKFRGLHQWGKYENTAKKGMMFVKDVTATEPYIFEALHDGKYGPFPVEGQDNTDWKSIGAGYPIINDLRLRDQRIREWNERKNDDVKIGDYFIYHNPYNGDTEYFQIKSKDAWYYPTDKSDNDGWHYVGRLAKKSDVLWSHVPEHQRDTKNPVGKKGWVYKDASHGDYYILRNDGQYGEFPAATEDNQWWQYLGKAV